ncbi:AfsR/SARP family transcriptional regulator [Actinomarinicola tropica]|uniref:Tetratricopeptide repeat protein n=1 Tax=Actinomarinicola tropica TaxID=2789776 RepID=A0A5Q2RJF7_9ACTN|nr:bacterial transcriptional activator domain-containing protein [Actinomarinicola tropica]QGG95022.1 tetratricopeptide repeat protein [Actinomarinicola tropica]
MTTTLQLLGGFEVRAGGVRVDLPAAGERLVALLALRRGPQTRDVVARAVWPATTPSPGARLLDTLLGRLSDQVRQGIDVDPHGSLSLGSGWDVDLDQALDAARRLHVDPTPVGADLVVFRLDLLPGWFEPWLDEVQARYRRLRMSVLRRVGRHQLDVGDVDDAADIALELLADDPCNEEAQLLLVEALLARGDHALARRTLDRFRRRLRYELGVEPTAGMRAAIARAEHPARGGV